MDSPDLEINPLSLHLTDIVSASAFSTLFRSDLRTCTFRVMSGEDHGSRRVRHVQSIPAGRDSEPKRQVPYRRIIQKKIQLASESDPNQANDGTDLSRWKKRPDLFLVLGNKCRQMPGIMLLLRGGHDRAKIFPAMLFRRRSKQLGFLVCLLLIIAYLGSTLPSVHHGEENPDKPLARRLGNGEIGNRDNRADSQSNLAIPVEDEDNPEDEEGDNNTNYLDEEDEDEDEDEDDEDKDDDDDDNEPPFKHREYREIFSLTTRDRKFFPMYFDGDDAYNPNIIPHPTKHDLWIVLAQHEQVRDRRETGSQLVCTAGFLDGVLVCTETPAVLAVTPSITGICEGQLAYINYYFGPRDARMFYGPDVPYIAYGSQSNYTCLGIWMQDVRVLLDAFHLEKHTLSQLFTQATELRRPAPWKGVEKNFFLFWDSQGKAYVHHDLWPKRVFAQLDFDGSVGEDLAPLVANKDQVCMAQYMPNVGSELESIHQATNVLSITLCKRSDPNCVPDDSNTFLMHIFHHKSNYHYHSVYEPYVLLFQRTPPFALHAISERPLWIHGRNKLTKWTASVHYEGRPESDIPRDHTEMFYVTSISWRTHGQKYHGHVDDPLLMAFGIEDTRAAGIDILAGDLLQDLAFC